MTCASCGAEVEEGADLCLECGEPMGDSPAARVARQDQAPASSVAAEPAPAVTTAQAARRPRQRDEEPEPVRCPACGVPSRKPRCPGCGVPLRAAEE